MKTKKFITKFLPVVFAEAHCDIPCGIYDPTSAKIAAKTVQRMVMQLAEFAPPAEGDKEARLSFSNSVSRRIRVKEEHAEVCKRELSILWSDFFKPEHLEKTPELHDMFWKALKLCSKNKQEIDQKLADGLVAAVDEIAEVFYHAKGDPKRLDAYKEITDKLF